MSAVLDIAGATLREATPLLLATLGGVVSERSGVINLALESYLLAGAFGAAAGTLATGSLVVGVLIGLALALVVALAHGALCVYTRADHVVTGVAFNLLVDAGTIAALVSVYGQKGATTIFPADVVASMNGARVPLPGLGSHSPITLLALVAIPLTTFWLMRTKGGLRVRAVGENPACAESLGVSAARVRIMAVGAAGLLAGLGGAYLALDATSFSKHMAGGRGYLALAAVVIGKWRPVWAATAALAFAALTALSNHLQLTLDIPDELLLMLPFVATLVVLSGVVGRARPPAALGEPLS